MEVHTETIKDYTINIVQDELADSPREMWDNLGTMLCKHSRYDLGDKNAIEPEKGAVILPLYLYDHSGITINTTGFSCNWDSGQVGIIYCNLDTIRKEYNVKRISKALRERVAKTLKSEVAVYDDYLTGNVYGFSIEKDNEITDSCYGFFGDYDGYVLEEARSIVNYCLTQDRKAKQAKIKAYIINKVPLDKRVTI